MTTIKSITACPVCHAPLQQSLDKNTLSKSALSCHTCNLDFPSINGYTTAALFKEPMQAIVQAYAGLHHAINQLKNQSKQYSDSLKKADKDQKKHLLPLIKALHDNQAIYQTWRDELCDIVDIAELLDYVQQNNHSNYGYNFNYLLRDWSTQADTEAEIAHLISALEPATQLSETNSETNSETSNALFLGAGTARLATELAEHHQHVIAVDDSWGQIVQFKTLLEKPINYWQTQTRNIRNDADIVKKVTSKIPESLQKAAQSIEYLWASATQLPLIDNSIDIIYSIYFSDVLPLDDLLKEVKRVLKKGGYFIHLGPLQYHFPDISQHYSYTTFCKKMTANGFTILTEQEHSPQYKVENNYLLINQRYIDKMLIIQLDN